MSRPMFPLSAIVIALGLLATAPPAGAAMDPATFVGNLGNQGIQALGPNVSPQARAARFRELFQNDFDVGGIARFALGRYWREYTPEQEQEFMRLFSEYTAQAYAALGEYGERSSVLGATRR